MATKINYSNDLTKVKEVIAEVCSVEFRTKFVFVTKSDKYYVYGDKKRYNSRREALDVLVKAGYKTEEIKFLDCSGGYRTGLECAFVEGNNSEWLDLVYFTMNLNVSSQDEFRLSKWGACVLRLYKDFKYKTFTVDRYNGELKLAVDNSLYNTRLINPEEASESDGLRLRKDIFSYMQISANDISSGCQKSFASSNNWSRLLSDKTQKTILRVFEKSPEEKIKHYGIFRNFIRHPGNASSNKATQTKLALLNDVLIPMIQAHPTINKELDKLAYDKAIKAGYDTNYGGSSIELSCHRIGDWIMFSAYDYRVFYNIKTDKKYFVNYYTHYRTESNIGIFRGDTLVQQLSPYGWHNYYEYLTLYKRNNNSYRYEDQARVRFINWKLALNPICLNESNEMISPLQCFEGTIIPDFLKLNMDERYKINIKGGKLGVTDVCSFGDLIDGCRLPWISLLLLFITPSKRKMAEQFYKLKLNGMLTKLLTDPNSFKEKSVSDSELSYWQRNKVFCEFDKNGTNLKKMFGSSMEKIRIYDRLLWNKYDENCNTSWNVPKMSTIQELVGDSMMMLDAETFGGYLEYCQLYDPTISQIASFKNKFGNRSPKEMLVLLKKIGSLSIYTDYLNMRDQYFAYFADNDARNLERIYELIPGKAKKFKVLRDRQMYSWTDRIESVNKQLNRMYTTYSNMTIVRDDHNNPIGVYLDMNEKEHLRLLHDELSEFITQHKAEIRQAGFKTAAERLVKYEYTGEELSIVAPRESTELAIEGGTLHHCVASFIDPVIRGTENVLFIRRNDMLDKPYYTVAISNSGTIEQIHSFANGHLTADDQRKAYANSGLEVYNKSFDIIGFLKEWAKNKKGLINPNSIKNQYGALCAR